MNNPHIVQLYYPVASGAGRYFAEVGERLAAEGHRVTVLSTDAYDLEYFWNPARRRVETPAETHNGVRIIRFPVHRIPGPPIVYPILRRLMVELSRVPGTAPLLRRMAMLTPRLPDMRRFFQAHVADSPCPSTRRFLSVSMGRAGGGIPPFALIHATNITLDFAIVPAFDFARAHGIPFIATPFVHLGPPGDSSILRYYSMRHQIDLLRRSARVITLTGLEGDALAARGVDRARMRRVGVGVNPAEVAGGDEARFRAEQRIDGQLVLYIGAMAFDKGAVHTVEAMQRLWARGENATLALIGAPMAHFTGFYERLPASDKARIRMLPYAPDQVKRDALAAADLFAMPSRTDSFGITYLEAWCYGLPVIGARAGGVPDVIDDGRDGLLVPFGDLDAIAGAIGRLLHDRAEARRLGAAGRAKVLRELTWDRIYAQVRAVYDEVVGDEGRRTKDEGPAR
jgi:glycogen(starch) synthase